MRFGAFIVACACLCGLGTCMVLGGLGMAGNETRHVPIVSGLATCIQPAFPVLLLFSFVWRAGLKRVVNVLSRFCLVVAIYMFCVSSF